jgi:hypothetical protein
MRISGGEIGSRGSTRLVRVLNRRICIVISLSR